MILKDRIIGYDIFVILVVFALIYIGFKHSIGEKNIIERKKYTIGETVRLVGRGNIYVVEYKYQVDSIEYIGDQRHRTKVKVPKGKYILIYDSLKVGNSIMLFDQRVKDYADFPDRGLDKIPQELLYDE